MPLSLAFEGWFECRLATDPDPSDEPRGVSGWTYAVAGEPDLDRTIRTRPDAGVVGRRPGPTVGVTIRRVTRDGGDEIAGHPLLGVSVELLDGPVFEGRNGLAYEDAEEPILPFHLRVAAGSVVLRRAHKAPDGAWIEERGQFSTEAGGRVRALAGISDPATYRAQRDAALRAAIEAEGDAVRKLALSRRLADLGRRGLPALGAGMAFGFDIGSSDVEVADPDDRLVETPATAEPWRVDIDVGAWDADALCGYMAGVLGVPTSAGQA